MPILAVDDVAARSRTSSTTFTSGISSKYSGPGPALARRRVRFRAPSW
jgi:hypothetical protein